MIKNYRIGCEDDLHTINPTTVDETGLWAQVPDSTSHKWCLMMKGLILLGSGWSRWMLITTMCGQMSWRSYWGVKDSGNSSYRRSMQRMVLTKTWKDGRTWPWRILWCQLMNLARRQSWLSVTLTLSGKHQGILFKQFQNPRLMQSWLSFRTLGWNIQSR